MSFRKATLMLAAAGLAATLASCAPAQNGPAQNGPAQDGVAQGGNTVTVFAAASLKSSFTRLAADFEAAHPGTKVTLNFAGSSELATQISQGAPADVFASADTRNMDKVSEASLLDGTATTFATNVLEIAVPPDNPASIASLKDLAKAGLKVVLCAPQVPCGTAAAKVQDAAGVALAPVSEESSVTDVLGKVTSGEADAGLVYVTDVRAAGDKVKGIPFVESAQAVNSYPIATTASARNKELARQFVALVTGSHGRKVLAEAGFGAP